MFRLRPPERGGGGYNRRLAPPAGNLPLVDVVPQIIPDVLLLKPRRFADARGWFMQTYSRAELAALGFETPFVQDNHSASIRRGTVRGLHFQAPPRAQAKLVRVVRGAVFDVAVDIRAGSPTFGRHVAVELSADNGMQLLTPAGFAHGFQTLTDDAEVVYKVTEPYAPECEGGLCWRDPALAIAWPIPPRDATLNARDQAWPTLATLRSPF